MCTHSITGSLWIVSDDRLKNAAMMKLTALRASFRRKDQFALFAEQVHNRIEQKKNKCVMCSKGKSFMKAVIGSNEGIGVIQVFIHLPDGFAHGLNILFSSACS